MKGNVRSICVSVIDLEKKKKKLTICTKMSEIVRGDTIGKV